jgi:multidrug resistance efflux pump
VIHIPAARSQIGGYDQALQEYAVETAELNLSNIRRIHDRAAVLFEAGAVSSDNLDEAALRLRQAEIALGQSRETLGKAKSAHNAAMLVLRRGGLYFDVYVPETSVQRFQNADSVPVYVAATGKTLNGDIRFVLNAPQYASARTTRDGAESDLSSFQVRIVLESAEDLLPGMTAEVRLDEPTS